MESSTPDIPVEILSIIFEFVQPRSTLLSAALASRRWHEIAIPHLYRCVDIRVDRRPDEPHGLFSATEMFFGKPELANYVRHFSLRERRVRLSPAPPPTFDMRKIVPTNDFEAEIVSVILGPERDFTRRPKWTYDRGALDLFLALLLPRLHKLKTLDLGHDSIYPLGLQQTLWRIARKVQPFDRQPALTSLQSFVCVSPGTRVMCRGSMESMYGAVYSLPSVRAVYVLDLTSAVHSSRERLDERLREKLSAIKPRNSSCTHLELKNCHFNLGETQALIGGPRCLTTFIYEIRNLAAPVSLAAIQNALEVHVDTLENFWLDYRHGNVDAGNDDDPSPMPSFRNFSKLRSFRIAYDYVANRREQIRHDRDVIPDNPVRGRLLELLPTSLEYLHITQGDVCRYARPGLDNPTFTADTTHVVAMNMYDGFKHLITNKCDALPSLQTFRLNTSFWEIHYHNDQLRQLRRGAQIVGVDFIVQENESKMLLAKWNDKGPERKWGMDEDVEWTECDYDINREFPFTIVDLDTPTEIPMSLIQKTYEDSDLFASSSSLTAESPPQNDH